MSTLRTNTIQNSLTTPATLSIGTQSVHGIDFKINNVTKATLDTSGNLGLGVTPSAWTAGTKALQIGATSYASIWDLNNGVTSFGSNNFSDGTNKFLNASSRYALQILQDTTNGAHSWRVSTAAGVAGGTITWDSLMTLDAKGNLGLGVTPRGLGGAYRSLFVGNTSLQGNVSSEASWLAANSTNQDKYVITGYASQIVQSAGTFNFYTAASGTAGATIAWGASKLTLNTTGQLGLGVTPSAWNTWKAFQIGHSGALCADTTAEGIAVSNNAFYDGANWKYVTDGFATVQMQGSTGNQYWYAAGTGTASNNVTLTELMKLSPNGNLQINCFNAAESGWDGVEGIRLNGDTNAAVGLSFAIGNTNKGYIYYAGGIPSIYFQTLTGTRIDMQSGSNGVYLANGGTSWTANSDIRLKTDLIPIENAVQKVSSLRAVTGRYKTDEVGTSRAFLVAQDVLAVLPEAVDTTDPEKYGVQYTDVVPLLVAAIKELSAMNETRQTQIQELIAKVSILESK